MAIQWPHEMSSSFCAKKKLDAGYPESHEDSEIKEMFDVSVDMSSVENLYTRHFFTPVLSTLFA